MTVLTRHDGVESDDVTFYVNGCLTTRLTEQEAFTASRRDPYGFEALCLRRITPLVWLAMPDHEQRSALCTGCSHPPPAQKCNRCTAAP